MKRSPGKVKETKAERLASSEEDHNTIARAARKAGEASLAKAKKQKQEEPDEARLWWTGPREEQQFASTWHTWEDESGRYRVVRRSLDEEVSFNVCWLRIVNQHGGGSRKFWDTVNPAGGVVTDGKGRCVMAGNYPKDYASLAEAFDAALELHKGKSGEDEVRTNAEPMIDIAIDLGLDAKRRKVKEKPEPEPKSEEKQRKEHTGKRPAPSGDLDQFGFDKTTMKSRLLAALTHEPQTHKQLAEKAGVPPQPTALRLGIESGKVVKIGSAFKLV